MNSFGRIFRVSIFGESHGPMVGCTIDGVPPGTLIDIEDMKKDISRRKSGGLGTTPRREEDEPIIVSGEFCGRATGAPLTILFLNKNVHSKDYDELLDHPRPGHADFVSIVKTDGYTDISGGGHFSGRLTLPIVAAGNIAKRILGKATVSAELIEVGGVKPRIPAHAKNDPEVINALRKAGSEGDSLGGIVECTVDSMIPGIGEPFWDSVESCLSHALFAIPGVRGIEFGDGFEAARMRGSEHNDPIGTDGVPLKNGAGGINGGLTNSAPIVFRVAFKPTASISRPQRTLNLKTGELDSFSIKGRHDVCFALRTPVIVEAMTAIVLADLGLIYDAEIANIIPPDDEEEED